MGGTLLLFGYDQLPVILAAEVCFMVRCLLPP